MRNYIAGTIVPQNTTVDYEFMDTKRFRTKESTEMFYTMLKYHLDHSDPYDVVIVGDDAALRFAMAFREDLFDGIPIVLKVSMMRNMPWKQRRTLW